MGKCKFNRIWLENIEFSALLKPVEETCLKPAAPFAKEICVCFANAALANVALANVALASAALASPALASAAAPATTPGDLRATFGSTSTLKAEVL